MCNDSNKDNDNINQKMYNTPSSVQRSFKYQNCYILNNLNNYQPKVIMGNKTKPNNKYNNIIINNKKEIIINNNSNNNNCYNNKKANGALISNNSNKNKILIKSPINCLNAITFNINNNYNNCCNNYINENDVQKNYIKFEGFNGENGLGRINCKSLSNLKEFSNFTTCCGNIDKIIDEKNNVNININNTIKDINSLKKNKNNNKRSTLFKDKSKAKIKSSQNIYSNTTNTNTNNAKKSNKSSINNTNSINNDNTSNTNNIINENKYKSKEKEQINTYIETNSNNNTNSYSKVNNKDLFYEEVNDNCCSDNYFNSMNNEILNSDKKVCGCKIEEIDTIKSLNIIKSKRNFSKNGNVIEYNYNLENTSYKSSSNIAYQTFSGPFRKNIIKVNMLEKEKNIKNEIMNINNGQTNVEKKINNINQKQRIYKKNFSNSSKKNGKKNLYIQSEYKGRKRYKKNNYIINSKLNKNNILIENHCQEKEDRNNMETKNENEELCINNDNEQMKMRKEDKNNDEQMKKNLYANVSMSNNYKLNKNSSLRCITSNLNLNIIHINGDNYTAYVKKKSSNMNVHNEYFNISPKTNRPLVLKNKKNYSISQSCYNTQRNSEDFKINIKHNNSNKYNILNSSKNNKNQNKTLVMPEYRVKLENIKSRVINLLNIYSLLALKNINISKKKLSKDTELGEDIGSEEY